MVDMCWMNQCFLTIYIVLSISSLELPEMAFRNPRRADWDVHEEVDGRLAACSGQIGTTYDLDCRANGLREALISAFEVCWLQSLSRKSLQSIGGLFSCLLWEEKLDLSSGSREGPGCCNSYYRLLTEYNTEVRKAKPNSWRAFCSDISVEREYIRLRRVLAKEPNSPNGYKRHS